MTGRGHDVGDLLGSMLDIMLGTMLGSPGMSLGAISTSLRMLTGLESSTFSFISKFSALVLLTSTFSG